MIFFVIGNGFDLHYKLNTSYGSFKRYLYNNGYRDLVDKVDELFDNHMYDTADIANWSDFENMLQVFNDLDAEKILDEAFANAEQDDDRADYFDSPAWNVSYYNDYVNILKTQFSLWINSIDNEIIKDDYFCPSNDDIFLTFNYTTTIEDNFENLQAAIIHIHGSEDQPIVLGHNSYSALDVFNILWDEDSDYRYTSAQEAANSILESASKLYFKNSKEILCRNKNTFDSIDLCEKVIIMGLSCGVQDRLYVKEIVKRTKAIDFYYYSDQDKENFSEIVGGKSIAIKYFKW